MNKYLMAFLTCLGIFALWILFQMFVVDGVIVGVLFCSAIFGAWKIIVNSGDKNEKQEEEQQQKKTEVNDLEEKK